MIRTIRLVSVDRLYLLEIFNLISKLFRYRLMIKLNIFQCLFRLEKDISLIKPQIGFFVLYFDCIMSVKCFKKLPTSNLWLYPELLVLCFI